MNRNDFYKINTLHGEEYLKEEYLKELYEYYEKGGLIYNYKIEISYDDFNKIMLIISNNLKIKLSDEEIKKSFLQYIQLLMSDAREGKYVDINWFINHVDYLSLDILDNTFLKKIKREIKNIKNELKNEMIKNRTR